MSEVIRVGKVEQLKSLREQNTAESRELSDQDELFRVQTKMARMHFEDGIVVPFRLVYDQFSNTPNKRLVTELEVAQAQLRQMQDVVCKEFILPKEAERLFVDPETHQPIPRNHTEQRYALAKACFARKNAEYIDRAKQEGIFLPAIDMETEQSLPADSLKLNQIYLDQLLDSSPFTEAEITQMLEHRRQLLEIYQVSNHDQVYHSSGTMVKQLNVQIRLIEQEVIRKVGAELQNTRGDLNLNCSELYKLTSKQQKDTLSRLSAQIDWAIEGYREAGFYVPEFDPKSGMRFASGSLQLLSLAKRIASGQTLSPEEIAKDRQTILGSIAVNEGSKSTFQPNEVFDSEDELVKLKALPKRERKEVIRIFRVKLLRQLTGFAQMREMVAKQLIMDPDMTKEEFTNIVDTYKQIFAFSKKQTQQAEAAWDGYHKLVSNISLVRESYPDSQDLKKTLFGRDFPAKIIYGPIAVIVVINSPIDYLRAARAYYDTNQIPLEPETDQKNLNTSGMVLNATLEPTVDGQVILINGRKNANFMTIKHESQHVINKVFNGPSEDINSNKEKLDAIAARVNQHPVVQKDPLLESALRKIKSLFKGTVLDAAPVREQKPQSINLMIRSYLFGYQRSALNDAKDEALAYFAEQENPNRIISYLTEKGKMALYDYLYKTPKNVLAKLWEIPGLPDWPLMIDQTYEILQDNYDRRIAKAVQSAFKLKALGFNNEQAIALLSLYPLTQWPTLVRRFAELQNEI